MTVNHSVKKYINESLPALLEKSENSVSFGKWSLCMCVFFCCSNGQSAGVRTPANSQISDASYLYCCFWCCPA